MMMTQIRNNFGQLIGTLNDHGDIIEARTPDGRLLGRYYVGRNVTEDTLGRVIAQGNVLSSLVWSRGQ